jgi:sialate O-acetylesterase
MLVALAGCWTFAEVCPAEVKLPAIFSDHMVLQQGMELPFWGTADPNEEVTVTVAGKSATTKANDQGQWSATAPAVEVFGPVAVRVAGKNTLEFRDVLIGDVWLCSGQSNMEWSIEHSGNPQAELAAANYPEMRFVQVPKVPSTQPLTDSRNPWTVVTSENVQGLTGGGGKFGQGGLSAVGYYFGRELHHRLQRPIGLIHCTWGGTICEAWTSEATLRNDGEYTEILARAATANADPNKAGDPNRASVLYNGMIAPIRRFAIKGAIWYQGESNAGRAYQYRKLFPAMIADWRKQWGQGDFPFFYVQLSAWMKRHDQPTESAWAELREAQMLTLMTPKTGMAVTIDIGDAIDIHPKNKQDVGKRLALNALSVAYGQNVVAAGPLYRSMTVEGNKIRIQFHHVGGGLTVKGEKLIGFAICGADKKFVWADAAIEGDSVLVSSPEVAQPIAVRYAWADNPACNLYNVEGLPASPFRTDSFDGITVNAK